MSCPCQTVPTGAVHPQRSRKLQLLFSPAVADAAVLAALVLGAALRAPFGCRNLRWQSPASLTGRTVLWTLWATTEACEGGLDFDATPIRVLHVGLPTWRWDDVAVMG